MQIEAIYHTSIVVGGVEHFYGGGIQEAVPGHTPYGQPIQVLELGYISCDWQVLWTCSRFMQPLTD